MPDADSSVSRTVPIAAAGDSPARALVVALVVALVCSVVVSLTAVMLKPRQDANRLLSRAASVTGMAEVLGAGDPQARFVDLATGAYVDRDPGSSRPLPADRDLAGLGRREDVAAVFELRDAGRLRLLILPVRGSAYQSTLKGYLALEGDLNTVAALSFYEQGETPGLGARIEDDAWRALWPGKQIADADGVIRLEVVKGAGSGVHEVDGISGATRTGNGVNRLLRFWLGADGYGPYLARLRVEAAR